MKMLVVGLGSIARKHIAILKNIDPSLEVFALRESVEPDVVPGIRNISKIDEAPPCDFAMIANTTDRHLETVRKLLPLHIPLFIEKPVFLTMEGVDDILRDIEKAKTFTWVGCHLRFHPCLQFLKRLLEEAKPQIVSVSAYCGSSLPDWQPGRDYTASFRADPRRSGGVHLELIHEMDYLRWIFGDPKTCEGTLRKVSTLKIAAPDDAHYDLSYGGFRAQIDLNYHRRDAKRSLTIVCEDATLEADLLEFTVTRSDETIFHADSTIKDVYEAQLREFLRRMEAKETSENDARNAVETLKLALSVSR